MSLGLRLLTVLAILLSLGLLYPGVTEPVLTLSGELERARLAELGIDLLAAGDDSGRARGMLASMVRMLGLDQVEGRVTAYATTRSIMGMARELAETGNLAVAVMIVTFSVVIPTLKLLLQLIAALLPGTGGRWLLVANGALSKWSMADVFVMAMLVAYMAGSASGHDSELLLMDARLERGFWFFTAYCVAAIAAGALLALLARREGLETGRSDPDGGASGSE